MILRSLLLVQGGVAVKDVVTAQAGAGVPTAMTLKIPLSLVCSVVACSYCITVRMYFDHFQSDTECDLAEGHHVGGDPTLTQDSCSCNRCFCSPLCA